MSSGFFRSGLFMVLLIVILFIIGCLFFYWAVDNYVSRNFDSDRYSMSKIQVKGNDTYMVWKFDKRTGGIELCSKTTDILHPMVCFRPSVLNAEDFTKVELDYGYPELTEKQCTNVVTSVMTEMDRWEAKKK